MASKLNDLYTELEATGINLMYVDPDWEIVRKSDNKSITLEECSIIQQFWIGEIQKETFWPTE